MKPMLSKKIIAVVGPTASGKSDLAVAIAKRFSGEIISADSRQVYRGMDIGTGKVAGCRIRMIPDRQRGSYTKIYRTTVLISPPRKEFIQWQILKNVRYRQ